MSKIKVHKKFLSIWEITKGITDEEVVMERRNNKVLVLPNRHKMKTIWKNISQMLASELM